MLKYYVPEKLQQKIHLYQRVIVPFSNRGLSNEPKKEIALIVHVGHDDEERGKKELKPIFRVVDPESILNQEQFELSERVSSHYLCSQGSVLFSMIPSGRKGKTTVADVTELPSIPRLNEDQKNIVDEIIDTALQEKKKTVRMHLLHGVTGSGKTRVYLELIQTYLDKNLGVMLLLPEIALSYQFFGKLKPMFGRQMAILHSGLGRSYRLSEYKRVLSGEANFVVGTRSAVFAPVRHLGLIVIDEEHDSSYKENFGVRYNTKWVAHNRLSRKDEWPFGLSPTLVAGSATPSLESMYFANKKVFSLHTLSKRATKFSLPKIHVEAYDASEQGADIFSPFLLEKMREHLNAGNQVILLLNRRGYSNFAFCKSCEKPLLCPHCSVSLTYHKDKAEGRHHLKCHMCGYHRGYTGKCFTCEKPVRLQGKGIQKAEDALEFHFPGVVYARMDQDTASAKGFVEDVLEAMDQGSVKVLIGTQMIAKGFDIKGVTLVGILNADIGLTLPDFRSSERVFQLLVQAAGRAGRHADGEVVMQTMQPHHPVIHFARNSDYYGFYEQEINLRRQMNYPPFCRMIRILLRSEKEDRIWHQAHRLSAFIREFATEDSLFNNSISDVMPSEIFGPVEAPMYKIRGDYRVHMLAKDIQTEKLHNFAKKIKSFFSAERSRMGGIKSEIDFDPIDIL